MTIIGIIKIF